ncbi:MAG: dihydrolipoyllysine-residue succinyltransferase [Enterobacterales bacterium]
MTDSIDILVPDLPESVTDATVSTWHKKQGEYIKCNEIIVDVETDKVILEIPAVESGILDKIIQNTGSIVTSGQIIGRLLLTNNNVKTDLDLPNTITDSKEEVVKNKNILNIDNNLALDKHKEIKNKFSYNLGPSIRRFIYINNLDKKNIDKHINVNTVSSNYVNQVNNINVNSDTLLTVNSINNVKKEKRVPMSRIRKRISDRLLESKNNTAMLTTFNEVNMKGIIDLRNKYKSDFENKHGIRLGFMSFFVKSVVEGLKQFPEINAFIDNNDIIYHDYFDINIAISTNRGLVAPVLQNVDLMSMADIEKKIKELSIKGQLGKLSIEELTGGNFTITNGGVFGSLISTPIINPPQSAILGMHLIKDRPIALNGNVIILPMMYIALSYDHRLIDGKEAVGFLIKIKNSIENPDRILLNI